jgi:hypothetical protein
LVTGLFGLPSYVKWNFDVRLGCCSYGSDPGKWFGRRCYLESGSFGFRVLFAPLEILGLSDGDFDFTLNDAWPAKRGAYSARDRYTI